MGPTEVSSSVERASTIINEKYSTCGVLTIPSPRWRTRAVPYTPCVSLQLNPGHHDTGKIGLSSLCWPEPRPRTIRFFTPGSKMAWAVIFSTKRSRMKKIVAWKLGLLKRTKAERLSVVPKLSASSTSLREVASDSSSGKDNEILVCLSHVQMIPFISPESGSTRSKSGSPIVFGRSVSRMCRRIAERLANGISKQSNNSRGIGILKTGGMLKLVRSSLFGTELWLCWVTGRILWLEGMKLHGVLPATDLKYAARSTSPVMFRLHVTYNVTSLPIIVHRIL